MPTPCDLLSESFFLMLEQESEREKREGGEEGRGPKGEKGK